MNYRVRSSVITVFAATLVLVVSVPAAQTIPSRERGAETPRSVRLYVFDCGNLHIADADMGRFRLTREEVATTDLAVPCFMVAHPKQDSTRHACENSATFFTCRCLYFFTAVFQREAHEAVG